MSDIPSAAARVLIIQHVSWEAPGLIERSLVGLPVQTVTVLHEADPPLPRTDQLAGLVVMGGPMNANDVEHYPGLAAECRLLAAAIEADVPTLGVCLGAQLMARALGARVEAGAASELGWAPVSVHSADDALLGPLAPATTVLHWHSDCFELPRGSTHLASTERTPVQAFRYRHSWGLQFHIEATAELLAQWLATPVMKAEARRVLGKGWRQTLSQQSGAAISQLEPMASKALAGFVDLVRSR